MKLAYARISTIGQNEARQIKALEELGIEQENIYLDKQSGKSTDKREKLKELLSFIRKGDTVYVESISRIARNTKDLLTIVDTINSRGAEFVSIKENIDTRSEMGKFLLSIFGAISELELSWIKTRSAEGVAIAKEAGKFKGGQKKKIDEEALKRECKLWREGKQTAIATMNKVGVKPNTFYRRVQELGL